MEAIIIIVVVGIIIFLIYQNLPSTKFEKAKSLYANGNILDSLNVLNSIFDKHPDAPAKIAEIKYNQGLAQISSSKDAALSFFDQVLNLKKRIKSSSNVALYHKFEAKTHYEISKLTFQQIEAQATSKNKETSIVSNIKYIDSNIKVGLESEFTALKIKHISQLAKLFYDFGVEKEKAEKYVDAISDYSKSLKHANDSSNSTTRTLSICRTEICKLKNGEIISENNLAEINKAPKSIQFDFYFRYAKRLLVYGDYNNAEKIITGKLEKNNKEVEKLYSFIKTDRQNKAIIKVDEINKTIENLYSNSIDIEEVKQIYTDIDKSLISIEIEFPAISSKFNNLRHSLFNRILNFYIDERLFGNAISLIEKFPKFYQFPELIKNIGVCSYNFAHDGNITEKNYKSIISNWLTAVYSDKVIIKSLEYTSWDDDYTFTLNDSIGAKYEIHDVLPENINYDEPTGDNISIGVTQRELLNQFEILLNKTVSNPTLLSACQHYYSYEKESIEKVIELLDKDILIAGPHFSKAFSINEDIIEFLDNEYSEYDNEEALQAGIPYLKDNSNTYVREYATAKELVDSVRMSIEREDIKAIKDANSDRKKSLLDKFETIKNNIQDSFYNILVSKIEYDDESDVLIKIMEEVIKFSPINDKLKYQYSTYVSNYCIGKVNNQEISNYEALILMKQAYFFSTSNPRICKNIVSLIRFNLLDILNGQTLKQTEIYKCLDEVYLKRSDVFKSNTSELIKARQDIFSQLKEAGVDISLFEENALSIRFGQTLNAEGEKIKRVLSYFKKMSEGKSSQVSSDPLRRLIQQLGLDEDQLPF
jgi:hypothetical protein